MVIGDRKPRRTRRPLWRLIVSVGLALLLLAWLIVTRPRVFRDVLQPIATTTPTASSLQTALPRPSPTTSPTPKPAVQLYHLGDTQHLDNIWLTPTKVVTASHVNGYDLNEGEIVLVAYLHAPGYRPLTSPPAPGDPDPQRPHRGHPGLRHPYGQPCVRIVL